MHEELIARSHKLLEFKKTSLSMLTASRPVLMLGQTNVSALAKHLNTLNVMQTVASKSRGFCNMSELWMDSSDASSHLRSLVQPIIDQVQFILSIRLKQKVVVFKAVIDTIDSESCILPHCDDFFYHRLGIRIHVPIHTSDQSFGVNFHPITYDATVWKMSRPGRIYAFNNFEPHTVTKLDNGTRSHLIMDTLVNEVLNPPAEIKEETMGAIFGRGINNTADYSTNFITHTVGNKEIRNRLATKYGAPTCDTMLEQMGDSNVRTTRQWLQSLVADKCLNQQVLVV